MTVSPSSSAHDSLFPVVAASCRVGDPRALGGAARRRLAGVPRPSACISRFFSSALDNCGNDISLVDGDGNDGLDNRVDVVAVETRRVVSILLEASEDDEVRGFRSAGGTVNCGCGGAGFGGDGFARSGRITGVFSLDDEGARTLVFAVPAVLLDNGSTRKFRAQWLMVRQTHVVHPSKAREYSSHSCCQRQKRKRWELLASVCLAEDSFDLAMARVQLSLF